MVNPSVIQNIILKGIDFITGSTSIFLGSVFILLILAWMIMSRALNLDDKTWQILTFIIGVFLFFGLLIMVQKGVINVKLGDIWNEIRSLFLVFS